MPSCSLLCYTSPLDIISHTSYSLLFSLGVDHRQARVTQDRNTGRTSASRQRQQQDRHHPPRQLQLRPHHSLSTIATRFGLGLGLGLDPTGTRLARTLAPRTLTRTAIRTRSRTRPRSLPRTPKHCITRTWPRDSSLPPIRCHTPTRPGERSILLPSRGQRCGASMRKSPSSHSHASEDDARKASRSLGLQECLTRSSSLHRIRLAEACSFRWHSVHIVGAPAATSHLRDPLPSSALRST